MKGTTYKSTYYIFRAFALSMPLVAEREDFMKRLEDECRKALSLAYAMMANHGWSQFKAYGYAEDLLEGMIMSLRGLGLYAELNLVLYYKSIAFNRMING